MLTTAEMLRREGEARGKVQGKREALLLMLRQRFGRVPAATRARIENASVAKLDVWLGRVLSASSLGDVLEGVSTAAPPNEAMQPTRSTSRCSAAHARLMEACDHQAMDDLPIWTREEIVRFTRDDDEEVRSWAWTWLARHHPEEAGRQAARGVADPDPLIVYAALAAYEAHPTPEAAIAIEALRARDDLGAGVREAIERLGQPAPPPSDFDLLQEQFDRDPEELRRRAPAMMLSDDPCVRIDVFYALGHQQWRWATDLLLEHFAAIVTSNEDTELWAALEDLSDPRTLPAILAAWSPGQCRAAQTYARIHRLAGLTGPLPEGIARDVEEAARYDELRRLSRQARPGVPRSGARRIDLLCRACRRTGEYECDPPTMAELADRLLANGLRVPARFPCKFCGTTGELQAADMMAALSLEAGAMAYEGERKERG